MYFTEKQLRIMKFIQQFRAERGISPTMEEIAAKIGVTKITIYDHLNQLERKGALRRERFRARSIEPLVWVGNDPGQLSIPLVGAFQNGSPSEDDKAAKTLDLKSIFPLNDQCFALKVQGDSLIGSQIRDGDYVIVKRRAEARNGDLVVVAVAGGTASLHRYYRERTRIRLQPSNCGRKFQYARARDVQILGVVIGLLRNFHPGEQN